MHRSDLAGLMDNLIGPGKEFLAVIAADVKQRQSQTACLAAEYRGQFILHHVDHTGLPLCDLLGQVIPVVESLVGGTLQSGLRHQGA